MFQTPNISQAQIVAVVGAILGVIVSAGLPLSEQLQQSIITLVTVLAPILIIGDAVIRNGRARGSASKTDAGSSKP